MLAEILKARLSVKPPTVPTSGVLLIKPEKTLPNSRSFSNGGDKLYPQTASQSILNGPHNLQIVNKPPVDPNMK